MKAATSSRSASWIAVRDILPVFYPFLPVDASGRCTGLAAAERRSCSHPTEDSRPCGAWNLLQSLRVSIVSHWADGIRIGANVAVSDAPLDIVFTAPHPDDLEIGMGGAIALLVKQGYRVGMIHMTNGEPTPRGTPEIRARERDAAAKVLGATVCETLDLPNRVL
ncbi:MAG: PIG-L family deacetylase, partial [Bacteroidetes bacterium]|nr:PIG-L family deacetylase [Bacteroidota bacterium]